MRVALPVILLVRQIRAAQAPAPDWQADVGHVSVKVYRVQTEQKPGPSRRRQRGAEVLDPKAIQS